MTLKQVKKVVENYKNNTLRKGAKLTKQAKADIKLLDLLINDIDTIIDNAGDLVIDLHTSDYDNIGVIGQNVGYLLAQLYDNKELAALERDNHTTTKYNRISSIKSYITSKPSAVSEKAPKYTYVYFVRATFHGLVRFNSKDFTGKRIVNNDIVNGKIVKVF